MCIRDSAGSAAGGRREDPLGIAPGELLCSAAEREGLRETRFPRVGGFDRRPALRIPHECRKPLYQASLVASFGIHAPASREPIGGEGGIARSGLSRRGRLQRGGRFATFDATKRADAWSKLRVCALCGIARCAGSVGGEGGIRTPGTLAGTSVFETDPIDHSGTSPGFPFGYLIKPPSKGGKYSRMQRAVRAISRTCRKWDASPVEMNIPTIG